MRDGGHPPSDIMYRVSGVSDGRLPRYVMIGLLHINRSEENSRIPGALLTANHDEYIECLVKCQITSEDSWNKILEWRPSQGAVVTETATDTRAVIVRR